MTPARSDVSRSSRSPGSSARARAAGVVRAEGRFRARRWAGRLRAVRPVVVVAALVTVLVLGGWTALGSSTFAVERVTVDGTSRLSVSAVRMAAEVPRGRSLFLVDPAAIRRRVAALPMVAHVRVTRRWPHTIAIQVVERRPAAVVETASGALLLDASGVPFTTVPTPPRGLLPVDLDGTVPGPGVAQARAAMAVVAALPHGLRRQVRLVRATSPDGVSLQLSGDRTVVWGSPADSAAKLVVLRTLLRHHRAHVYDVSTPGVAVTR